MHEFFRNTLTKDKMRHLFINTALGNFAGYVAGSLLMVLSTYHSVERRALRNLFGVLPRHKVVVHLLPEWLEWVMAVFIGFLVMEFVRYLFNRHQYARFVSSGEVDQPAEHG